jgi:hypothetical protein
MLKAHGNAPCVCLGWRREEMEVGASNVIMVGIAALLHNTFAVGVIMGIG